MMTKGMIIANKKAYVEDLVGEVLSVLPGFESIKFAHDNITDSEYVRISDEIGDVIYMNVTASEESEILRDICKVVAAGDLPFNIIHDVATKRKIAPLFR